MFFCKVEFVFVLEPSLLITTAQIGLHTIAELCGEEEKKTVYCLCDKNCDGLVDAMSHILMTSLTEVFATKKYKGTLSYMCWEADGEYLHHRQVPDVARYLGMGTELSFAALKNQVSRTFWYGGSAFPVTDMQWIAQQYYYDLMKYADLPTSQEVMESCFLTTPNFWSAEINKNNYFTVEDESFNMYEILREFSTRSTEQGFVNVISSAYLLKEYMADNGSIFETDAKAIPYIVADFARTTRNVILVLLLLMSEYGVDEEKIRKEFALAGLPIYHIRKQLWYEIFRTFSTVKSLAEIPKEYRQAVETVFTRTLTLPDSTVIKEENVIKTQQRYSVELGRMQTVYFLTDKKLTKYFVSGTKSASYISEDEKGERYYLGAELCDHIYQRLLPKQFFTYSGKYYEMLYVTSAQQVLVRRAADHINGRPSYRQIRHYHISAWKTAETIGAVQQTETMTITRMYADFSVQTDGYFAMNVFNDFSHAEKIIFQGEKSRIPDRSYLNKAILKITLPSDGLNDKVRYTVALLINEIFRTLFAENSPYIVALTDISHIDNNCAVSPLTYDVTLPLESEEKSSIFIVEDSHLDMGLLVAVERNLKRIFRIMQDYLLWNTEKLQNSRGSIQTESVQNSDNAVFQPLPYDERYYLLYGMENEPDVLATEDTLSYLNTVLKDENPLEKARKGVSIAEMVKHIAENSNPNVRKCDFCGSEIYGTEYETLADGRDRCMRCSRTAVKTEAEFVRIFEDVKRNMEMFFNIKINTGIKIEMVNARKLNKAVGHTFVPTAEFDGRVLGVAIHRHGCFSIMVENGSPRMMTILTMAHELTHIWQYLHWKQSDLLKKYGKNLNLQIYEGMAKWVEIQYAYLINEPYVALREENITVKRNDEYGKGYLRYKANYPLSTGTVLNGKTPFMNVDEPLAMLYCQENNSPTLPKDNP